MRSFLPYMCARMQCTRSSCNRSWGIIVGRRRQTSVRYTTVRKPDPVGDMRSVQRASLSWQRTDAALINLESRDECRARRGLSSTRVLVPFGVRPCGGASRPKRGQMSDKMSGPHRQRPTPPNTSRPRSDREDSRGFARDPSFAGRTDPVGVRHQFCIAGYLVPIVCRVSPRSRWEDDK